MGRISFCAGSGRRDTSTQRTLRDVFHSRYFQKPFESTMQSLKSTQHIVRITAALSATVCGCFGTKSAPRHSVAYGQGMSALRSLTNDLGGPSAAMWASCELVAVGQRTLPALAKCVRSHKWRIRYWTAAALGNVGGSRSFNLEESHAADKNYATTHCNNQRIKGA